MRLTASCIICETQDGVAMLGFADDELNTRQYVMLQRGVRPANADRQVAFDSPHIEVNSQTHSGYGGVVKAQLRQDRLVLTLDPQAAADMSVDDTIDISFRLSMGRLKEVGEQLRLVLGNAIVQVDGTGDRGSII